MTAAEIAEKLGAHKFGDGWRVKCPAHDGKSADSLAINKGETGKPVFYCHGGCTQREVIESLRAKGAWSNGHDASGDHPPARHFKLGKPDHRYPYTTGAGRVLGYVYRWNATATEEKKILPVTKVDGAWQWAAMPKPWPLYRQSDTDAHGDAPVLIVEGEKAAEGALSYVENTWVTTWPGGAKAAKFADLAPLKGRRVCLWPDNDPEGRKAMVECAALLLKAGAAEARIVDLPDGLPHKWDLGDALPAGWTDATIADMIESARGVASQITDAALEPSQIHVDATSLGLLLWNDIDDIGDTDRLVKGLIGENSLSIIAGPTGSGKTFIALDIGAHAAAGWDWFDRPVMRCGVLYVGAEGQAGVKKRIKAWKAHHSAAPADMTFALFPAPIDLVTDPKGAEAVIARVELLRSLWGIDTWLVVLDTLARCFGSGDESATQDMNRFVVACDAIRNRTGAAVMVVHHFGKDESKGMRGSIALKAAADTVIEVTGLEGVRTAKVEKQKDGAAGEKFSFMLRPVEIGTDEDGVIVTSCIVEQADAEVARKSSPPPMSASCKTAYEALKNAVTENGQPAPANNHIPAGIKVVPTDLWRRYAYAMAISNEGPDAKRKAFKRAAEQLQARGVIAGWQEWVWPV